MTAIRIYAACLASYNSGRLHGAWIDATQGYDAMQDGINAMLKASPVADAEEWAIHDHEGLPASFGEFSSLATVEKFASLADDFANIDTAALAAVIDYYGGDLDDTRAALEDRFCGIFDTMRGYSDELADCMMDANGIAEGHPIRTYFDYEAYASDTRINMNVIEVPGGVAVFHA